MGLGGNTIVKLPINKLVEKLNKALADEWLAYYQYWIGSKVVEGLNAPAVKKELIEHAEEELKHAGMLVDRIVSLGGTPLLSPQDWVKFTNCGYAAPEDTSCMAILEQNVKGERCAIGIYNKLLEMTKEKDEITFQMVLDILNEEIEHEDDLEKLIADIKKCK